MGTHGFARKSEFALKSLDDSSISFSLTSNEDTKKEYPFDFELIVTYTLSGYRVDCIHEIINLGDKPLIATTGAHPGFNVPLDNGSFEDWYVEFSEDCSPDELVFSDTCFNTGYKRPFEIENSRIIRLSHRLFDIDAVFMSRIAPAITLKSAKSERFVRLEYADMPYLGLWHMPKSDAPYVCIEPWCGLPSFDGKTEDLSEKCDMLRIGKGSSKTVKYAMIFG